MIDLSPKQAIHQLLNTRLVFGNAQQIEALSVLRMAEDLIGSMHECPECDGKGEEDYGFGECSHCGRACPYCDLGVETCRQCDGAGEVEWGREEVYKMGAEQIVDALKNVATRMAA